MNVVYTRLTKTHSRYILHDNMVENRLLGLSVEQLTRLKLPQKDFDLRELIRMASDAGNWSAVIRNGATAEMPVNVEFSLYAEWQKQSQNFLRYSFHREGYADTEAGKQAYLDSLPRFEPQPLEYRTIFDRPLLFEKRIPWERQADLADILISDYLRSRLHETHPWEDNPSKTPEGVACAGWFNKWGQRFPNKIKPLDARKQLGSNEGAGDVVEGIANQIHFPEDNENGQYFDLIGTSVGSGRVVDIYRWGDQPRLHARWSDDAAGHWRPLVHGSEIVTGKLAA